MVPDGWQDVRLGDLTELVTSGSRGWAEYYNDVGDRFIRITNLRRDNIALDLTNLRHVKLPLSSSEGQRTQLKQGDILISITADLGLIGYIEEKPEIPSYINQHIALVRLKQEQVFSKFIAHLLSSANYQQIIRRLNDAGTKAGLNLPTIKSLPIAKPSIYEQEKIARILSTWDRAIKTIEKLIENSRTQKKALIQQLLTGLRRFPGFTGKWKYAEFNDLFLIVNDKRTQIKSSDYLESGITPIVDQGQSQIAGFTNNESVYSDVPVIIFGDHTRIVKWVDFPFAPGADGTQILKTKNPIGLRFGFNLISHANVPNLGYSRHMKELKEKEFKFPIDVNEQKKIDSVIVAADREIKILQQKLACLKQEKKALMQQLLTGKRRVKVDES